ncbi:MAG: PfkB family carbohydrate kinase, partial [Candidatus Bathyarchaeia archaeon]
MFNIVSAGHFCIDSITLPGRNAPCVILGGSVTYVSLAARRLGAEVSIVSKVGEDFPKAYMWWLSQEGIDLSTVVEVRDAKTTKFELEYDGDLSNRRLRLISKGAQITVEDLPKSLRAKV